MDSDMEVGKSKLESISASMQHSSAPFCKDIAQETIPKTSAVPKRFSKPWFSDICKDAIKERNRFKREPTEGNLIVYRIAKAKASRNIRHSKIIYWRNYVSKMNS